MSEKTQLLITLVFLLFFLIVLIHQLVELKRPRYLKPKSFFKMHDSEDGILADAAKNGVIVTHHYAKDLFVDDKNAEFVENSVEDKIHGSGKI